MPEFEDDDIQEVYDELVEDGVLSEAQAVLVTERRSICQECGQNAGLHVLTVTCDKCGCEGLSLIRGRCKMRKWKNK